MSLKTEFMKTTTYQEYDKRRDEFSNLDILDPEIMNHLDELYPTLERRGNENGIIMDVHEKIVPDNR